MVDGLRQLEGVQSKISNANGHAVSGATLTNLTTEQLHSMVKNERPKAGKIWNYKNSVDCTTPQQCKLPSAPKKLLSPNSYKCFHDTDGMKNISFAFSCLASMTHCGEMHFIDESKVLYGDSIQQWYKEFNKEGQIFLTKLQQCVLDGFQGVYSQGIVPCCASLQQWGVGGIQVQCFKSAGFCSVFMSNVDAFINWFNYKGAESIYALYFSFCT